MKVQVQRCWALDADGKGNSDPWANRHVIISRVHTQNPTGTVRSSTYNPILGEHKVHSLSHDLKTYSTNSSGKNNRASHYSIILYHLHEHTHTHTTQSFFYHLLYCTNKEVCVKAWASQFFFNIPCMPLSLATLLTTHASDHHLIAGPSWINRATVETNTDLKCSSQPNSYIQYASREFYFH